MDKNPHNKKQIITAETLVALMQYAPSESVIMNISCGVKDGGTGLYNFNATEVDGKCVLTVLKEMDCPYFFVVPLPCFGVYPWDGSSTDPAFSREAFSAAIANTDMSGIEHNTLCVHQYPGGSGECRQMFKELMVQEYAAAMPGETMVSAASDAVQAIDRIMSK